LTDKPYEMLRERESHMTMTSKGEQAPYAATWLALP
jgi:hypothetical protein